MRAAERANVDAISAFLSFRRKNFFFFRSFPRFLRGRILLNVSRRSKIKESTLGTGAFCGARENGGIRVLFNERRRSRDDVKRRRTAARSSDIPYKRNNRLFAAAKSDGAKRWARSTERRDARRNLRKAFYVS